MHKSSVISVPSVKVSRRPVFPPRSGDVLLAGATVEEAERLAGPVGDCSVVVCVPNGGLGPRQSIVPVFCLGHMCAETMLICRFAVKFAVESPSLAIIMFIHCLSASQPMCKTIEKARAMFLDC